MNMGDDMKISEIESTDWSRELDRCRTKKEAFTGEMESDRKRCTSWMWFI